MSGLFVTLALGLFIMLGTIIALYVKNNENFITFSIGLAFGVMFMLVIFDLLPEVTEIFFASYRWYFAILIILSLIIVGILLLKMLDYFVPDHDHEDKHEDKHLHHIGIVSTVAISLHNIIEGMAIYSVFLNDLKSGILLSIGVGLHNLPLGMAIASMFYNYNGSRVKTLFISLFMSLTTFIGGVLLYIFGSSINEIALGALMAITLGMIIYIMFFELFIHIKNEGNKKISIFGILTGIIIIFISILIH